jgi:repressor LexA
MSPTARQMEVLRFIIGYRARHRWRHAPTFQEIADGVGLASTSGVFRLLNGLEERGHIRRLPNCSRAMEVLTNIPVPRSPDGEPLYFVRVG